MKKKHNPNSKYWRKKCDKLITDMFKNKPCAICGTTYQTCGHHIVEKSLSAALRHDLRNIIPLCPAHHKFSNAIAPHSSYLLAVTTFKDWLKKNNPKGYYCLENWKKFKRTRTYEEIYKELSNGEK